MSDNQGNAKCGKCEDDLPNDGEHASCRLCQKKYHFGTCSMKADSWRGLGKPGQKNWACASCRNKKKTPGSSQDEKIAVMDIASRLDSLLEMKASIGQIELSMQLMSSKYDELLKEMKEVRKENKDVKTELKAVEKKLQQREETIKQLETRVSEMEQYGRRVNLEIHGVSMSVRGPKLEDEKTEEVVQHLAKEIGVPYRPEEIHKLPRRQRRQDGRPPAIIVQFTSTVRRDAWLQAGKKARLTENGTGNKIYFNENLTVFYKGLLREVKDSARMHNYKYVWFTNGKILVRKYENKKSVIVIKSYDDLSKISA